MDFDGHFDFDGRIEGQGIDTDRCANMSTRGAEDLSKQIAGAIGDAVLLGEAVIAVDKYAHAQDARKHHPLAADFVIHRRQCIENTLPGRSLCLLQWHLGGHFPGSTELPGNQGQLAGDKDQVASTNGGHIGGKGFGFGRKGEIKLV